MTATPRWAVERAVSSARVSRTRIALLAACSLGGADLCAHEDPRGDVHPTVVTTSDRFEVYFTNNREKNATGNEKVYRTTFSAEGKPVTSREPFEGEVPTNHQLYLDMALVEGRPVLEYLSKARDQHVKVEPRLPLGTYADCCMLQWSPESQFVMRDSPVTAAGENLWPFSLRIVDTFSGKLLGSTVIGNPGRIYHSARTSAVISHGAELVLAWMEKKQFPPTTIVMPDGSTATVRNAAYRVVVTRWQPEHETLGHSVAAAAVSDNVSIGIGRINHVVLVAWHEFGKIRTRFIDLDVASFVPELPELRHDPKIAKKVMQEMFGESFGN